MLSANWSVLFLGSLLISSTLAAQTEFPMTVVKTARVSPHTQPASNGVLNCVSSNTTSKAQSKIESYSSHGQKAIKLLELSPDSSLFAQQNTDDHELNDVTLWIQIRGNKQVQNFQISQIAMHEYTLPKVQLVKGVLVIQADTINFDPEEDKEWSVRNTPGQLYQTIRLGSLSQGGLSLSTFTCE